MWRIVLYGLLWLPVCVGCGSGPKLAKVSGKVTIDDQPLTAGFVRFVPTAGQGATGKIQPDGTFKLIANDDREGVPLGQYQIEVVAVETQGSNLKYLAPKRYQDFATSQLTATIDKPTDSIHLQLTWNGEQRDEAKVDTTGDLPPP